MWSQITVVADIERQALTKTLFFVNKQIMVREGVIRFF